MDRLGEVRQDCALSEVGINPSPDMTIGTSCPDFVTVFSSHGDVERQSLVRGGLTVLAPGEKLSCVANVVYHQPIAFPLHNVEVPATRAPFELRYSSAADVCISIVAGKRKGTNTASLALGIVQPDLPCECACSKSSGGCIDGQSRYDPTNAGARVPAIIL